ncbi:hypothetical protein [Rhodococcoides fascians]|uniref:hypothetical protein n=1 Tax=Rhodococcoides fascians TaxID=1828 RepID=UPI0012D2A67F|nr:hypothetical protein [Rhodococcus fascians]
MARLSARQVDDVRFDVGRVTAAFDSVADFQHRKRSAGVDAYSASAFTSEDRRRARGD